ncbi:MAG: LacI family DNA-binding transcriptional regulator [Pricia sp.]
MKKKKKVGLKEIAKDAGVSIATVSYVLSKGKNSRVSVEMSKKIEKIAKDLNYQPNRIAQSLKSGKTFTIGLIVADISNPFFAHIARIIEDEASKSNYTVIFGSSDEKPDKTMHLLEFFANRQVDGFILAPSRDSNKQILFLQERGIPFVLIDRFFPEIETNYVAIDNYEASYKATERLVNTGNSKIGMIAYDTPLFHMKERIRGYEEALENNAIEPNKKWLKEIDVSNIQREIAPAIEDLLKGEQAVESLFFATNTLAIAGLKHLEHLNLKVPDDVRIVSFDEGEAFDFFYCPLTHVRQPLAEMGKKAVEILIEQITDPENIKQKISLNAELVLRQSCRK